MKGLNLAEVETFESVRPMIWDLTYKYYRPNIAFWRHHGFDENELFSIACYGYAKAVETYDHTLGVKFITYVNRIVRNELSKTFNHYTRDKRTRREISRDAHDSMPDPETTHDDGLSMWEGLSKDAQLLIKLVIDTPENLRFKNRKPDTIKRGLKQYVLGLGWDRSRWLTASRELSGVFA